MQFSKIHKLCKNKRNLILYSDTEVQWISDGFACYPLYGLPTMGMENIQNLLGIDDTERDSWVFSEQISAPSVMFTNTYVGEKLCDALPIQIKLFDVNYLILETEKGAVWVKRQYLDALSVKGTVEMFLRYADSDRKQPIIIVKQGLINYGCILPQKIDSAQDNVITTFITQYGIFKNSTTIDVDL